MKTRSAVGKSAAAAITVDANVTRAPARRSPRANDATATYNKEAMALLQNSFPLVSVDAIRWTYKSCGHSFTAAYRILLSIQILFREQNDEMERRQRILERAPFLKDVKRIHIKSERKMQAHRPSNPTLLAELDGIPEMNAKENRSIKAASKREDHRREETKITPKESLFECACCFNDECRFDAMCQCDEGHLVCSDCLRHYVEEQLDGKGVGLLYCMDMEADMCKAMYNSTQLDKAFSPKSRQKVDEKMFRFHFEQVEMDDSCQCPKCNYLFFLQAGFVYTHVSCPECKHAFCQLCNELPHKGKTCEEAKAEKENLDAYASTAEAMTDAVVRTCPKCKKRFFKEEGCNKMTCPSCKTKSCYFCRQIIKDYSHYCRTPHCNHESCNKCVLHTNAKEDDRLARREVAQKALLAAQKREGAPAAAIIGGLLSPSPNKHLMEGARDPLQPVRQALNGARPNVDQPPPNEPVQRQNVIVQQHQQQQHDQDQPQRGQEAPRAAQGDEAAAHPRLHIVDELDMQPNGNDGRDRRGQRDHVMEPNVVGTNEGITLTAHDLIVLQNSTRGPRDALELQVQQLQHQGNDPVHQPQEEDGCIIS